MDSRARRVLFFLAGLWAINVVDLALTLYSSRGGLLYEANPLAAFILARGPAALCLYKGVLVAGGSSVLVRYRRRRLIELTAVALLVVYLLVAVQWATCYDVYELMVSGHFTDAELCRIGGWRIESAGF